MNSAVDRSNVAHFDISIGTGRQSANECVMFTLEMIEYF